jgi:hypothetical protein
VAKWKVASHIQWRDRAGFSPASLLCPDGHPKRPKTLTILCIACGYALSIRDDLSHHEESPKSGHPCAMRPSRFPV